MFVRKYNFINNMKKKKGQLLGLKSELKNYSLQISHGNVSIKSEKNGAAIFFQFDN